MKQNFYLLSRSVLSNVFDITGCRKKLFLNPKAAPLNLIAKAKIY